MGIHVKFKETEFGVGDRIKVSQKIKEKDKERLQIFEGILIAIKGKENDKSITVRRIGSQKIGIEKIFPLSSPSIAKVEVVKKGSTGTRKSKLYYIRNKARREVEKIYNRIQKRKEGK